MLSIISSILSGVIAPILNVVQNIFIAKSNVQIQTVTEEAQVTAASITGMAAVEKQWSFVALLIPLYGIPFAVYYWKILVWDKVFAPLFGIAARTDPLGSDIQSIAMLIIGGIFLHNWIRSK